MTICAGCWNTTPAPAVRDLCACCIGKLPRTTRQAYAAGQCDTRRAVELLMLRYTSLAELRGGRHTR